MERNFIFKLLEYIQRLTILLRRRAGGGGGGGAGFPHARGRGLRSKILIKIKNFREII